MRHKLVMGAAVLAVGLSFPLRAVADRDDEHARHENKEHEEHEHGRDGRHDEHRPRFFIEPRLQINPNYGDPYNANPYYANPPRPEDDYPPPEDSYPQYRRE